MLDTQISDEEIALLMENRGKMHIMQIKYANRCNKATRLWYRITSARSGRDQSRYWILGQSSHRTLQKPKTGQNTSAPTDFSRTSKRAQWFWKIPKRQKILHHHRTPCRKDLNNYEEPRPIERQYNFIQQTDNKCTASTVTTKRTRGESSSKPEESEDTRKDASPAQNSQVNNISSKLEGFHILEIHTLMLGNGMGLLLTIFAITIILIIYRQYRKRLSVVKRLR